VRDATAVACEARPMTAPPFDSPGLCWDDNEEIRFGDAFLCQYEVRCDEPRFEGTDFCRGHLSVERVKRAGAADAAQHITKESAA
jgi:hypothetical protein